MSEQGKRKHLGRGLSALFGDEGAPVSVSDNRQRDDRVVPVEYLHSSEFQPRRYFDPDALQSLVDSIREKGVLEPILVRANDVQQDTYEIIAGERRWRAAQAAGLHKVPIIVKQL
ncbi:MAG: ParB/RepB/Spo0J family partition protein, partial [Pseudomonadota bacterium]|nr:ParB/RepB/Spo0J family partition protein [Pseudomonadota bacterium]